MIRVLAVLLLATPALHAQIELKWKWRVDDSFYVRTVTTLKQTLLIEDPPAATARAATLLGPIGAPLQATALAGVIFVNPPLTLRDHELKQTYEHSSWMRYSVIKRNDDGSAVVKQQVVPQRALVRSGDVIKPDNTLDDVELLLHVDARGRVSRVEGADALLKKLSSGDTAKSDALREAISESGLAASATQALGIMPPGPVKADESWTLPSELRLGTLGRLQLERTFTLQSVEEKGATKLALLGYTSRVAQYNPDDAAVRIAGAAFLQRFPLAAAATNLLAVSLGGGLAFRIESGGLTQAQGKGSVEIDLDAGRLKSAKGNFMLRGFFTLRNNDVIYSARLAQIHELTITVSDKLPDRDQPRK